MIKCGELIIRFHPLFVMLMMISVVTGFFVELITLFVLVFIHELGHVVAAKSFGWRVLEVQLLPFGGVAVVDESHSSVPIKEEIVVALAGPLQNGILILCAYYMQHLGYWHEEWSSYFIQANLFIGGFNLLPILPLDGGKILQAIMSLCMNYYHSLIYCTWVSLMMSTLMVAYSLYPLSSAGLQLNLLLIGGFLVFSNYALLRGIPYQYIRFLMGRETHHWQRSEQAIHAKPIVVKGSMPLKQLLRTFKREQYHIIYVTNERGELQKVIPEQQVIKHYFSKNNGNSAVSDLFM